MTRGRCGSLLLHRKGLAPSVSCQLPDAPNQNFQQLQGELADLENKIAAARRFLNNAVAEYNAAREAFPGALIADRFGFESADYFDVAADEKTTVETPPDVRF